MHQITITVSDKVYEGLKNAAKGRSRDQVIEDLTRPLVDEEAPSTPRIGK